jgi:hypothetical protein
MAQLIPTRGFVALAAFAFLASAGLAQATDIMGTISSTVTITENSQLVGDVTCKVSNAPCIKFGASAITLNLNGFSITGQADPPARCTPTGTFDPEDGIDVVAQHDVAILGPGLVQKFARVGIFLGPSTTKARVEGVTASDNCFSGILLIGASDNDIEKNVSVRNSIGSQGFPCGGT